MRAAVLCLVLASVRIAQADPTCDEPPCAGNAWHLPAAAEPGIATMRQPLRAAPGAPLVVYSGNQFAGDGGNPGNQTQAGSRVLYRLAGGDAWSEAPLVFFAEAGNNKYYQATLPPIAAGDELHYYLRIAYSDHPVTFVHGGDDRSATTLDEEEAQASPFRAIAERALEPSGPITEVAGAEVHASGHVGFAGVVVAPPLVQIDGSWRQLGALVEIDGDTLTHALGDRDVTSRLSAGDGVVRWEVTDWGGAAVDAVELQAASPADEHFYGLGEKFDRVDQAGKVARVMAVDAPGDKGDRSYKVVPWFVSTRGYGVHLASTHESRFDLRGTRDDRWAITQRAGGLAVDLIAGPTPADALRRFTAIAGRPPPPPPWAFAPWLSTDHWRDGGEVRYAVTRYRALGLPGSVFVFDSPWEVAYNDLAWNEVQFARGGTYQGTHYDGFASAADMLAFLDDAGFKVVVWLTPFINVSSHDEDVPGQETGRTPVYDQAAAAGYFVRASPGGPPLLVDWWKGRGSPVDFTNPAARAWFQARLAALVDASGGVIAGFKTDDGESDFIPDTAAYFDGRTGLAMKNGYSVAYHGAVYQVLGDAGVLWSRSGFTGTQAFPGHWAGDNEPNFGDANGLPSVIVAGLSAAMSGWSIWGHDIGGYQESNPSATPAELFMRWAQFGALSPIMQLHRQVGGGRQYPWSYGDEALEVYRRYARLHTALWPYLYTYVVEAGATGMPVMRPPVLHHPDDPATFTLDHTYYLGEHLLVAPVVTNQDPVRRVYLPAGRWINFFDGAVHDGGQVIEWSSADPARMPLFVRAGAILPMLPDDTTTLVEVPAARIVHVYPDGEGAFTTHDGTTFTQTVSADRTTITVDGAPRPYTFQVHAAAPRAVRIDGVEVPWTEAGGVVAIALEAGRAEIVLWYAEPPPPGPDAGEDPAGEPGAPAGCGCTGGGDGTIALCLLMIGLAGRRRCINPACDRSRSS